MITISAFAWVPSFAHGQVRDLRVQSADLKAGWVPATLSVGQLLSGPAEVQWMHTQLHDWHYHSVAAPGRKNHCLTAAPLHSHVMQLPQLCQRV